MDTRSPQSLIEAVRYFSDLDRCHAYMANLKWPDGVVQCWKCGSNNVGLIASRRMFQCKNKECRKQFSVKVGTIFEDSALGLDKWFVAVWCITNAKNGISSCELARAVGVTQKSAWHMLHRIRHAMQTGSFTKIGGDETGGVEADETYIGGKLSNMHAKRRAAKRGPDGKGTGGFGSGKSAVMGLLERHAERGSRIRAEVIDSTSRKALHAIIRKHVVEGTEIYTDALQSYAGMAEYVHAFIDHAETYVAGKVHTNGLENFWSLLKRSFKGTYVSVDASHLARYLDEQVFRFNERKTNDAGRFAIVMPGVLGKRLTYAELIGDVSADNLSKDGQGEGAPAN